MWRRNLGEKKLERRPNRGWEEKVEEAVEKAAWGVRQGESEGRAGKQAGPDQFKEGCRLGISERRPCPN